MRVHNPDRSPLSGGETRPKLQRGIVEVVGDDFPVFQSQITVRHAPCPLRREAHSYEAKLLKRISKFSA
jgi:hypothetical protein